MGFCHSHQIKDKQQSNKIMPHESDHDNWDSASLILEAEHFKI